MVRAIGPIQRGAVRSRSQPAGWPEPSNPYARPAIYIYPDWAQVMLHLKPAK